MPGGFFFVCVWCSFFDLCYIILGDTRMSNKNDTVVLAVSQTKELVCNLLHLIYFYNETGSQSSGGLETSSGKALHFPSLP